MNKLCSIVVTGNDKTWSFNAYVDTKYIDEWRKDGIEIYELENIVPSFVVDIGLLRVWIFLQDLWNGKYLRRFIKW
jgi:hypothetical protein